MTRIGWKIYCWFDFHQKSTFKAKGVVWWLDILAVEWGIQILCAQFFLKWVYRGSNPSRLFFLWAKEIGRLGLSTANKHLEMSKKVKYTKDFPQTLYFHEFYSLKKSWPLGGLNLRPYDQLFLTWVVLLFIYYYSSTTRRTTTYGPHEGQGGTTFNEKGNVYFSL